MGEIFTSVCRTPEGGWRIAGSRISLDSVVLAHLEGQEEEAILEDFPSLSLEQVRGALTFYDAHREEIDRHLAEQARRWEQLRQESETANSALLDRVRGSRSSPSGDARP